MINTKLITIIIAIIVPVQFVNFMQVRSALSCPTFPLVFPQLLLTSERVATHSKNVGDIEITPPPIIHGTVGNTEHCRDCTETYQNSHKLNKV